MKNKTKSRIAFSASLVLMAAAFVIGAFLLRCRDAADTPPSPDIPAEEAQSTDADGFPEVDWAYWQGVNPDVIGWLTVPGTTIDSPILQAHADAPDYYLHHDVYRNYNPAGGIFLDADCEEYGLSSRNAVILGHHFLHDPVTAPMGNISLYKDRGFAEEHADILVQTPQSEMAYRARFAQIVNGLERNKRTSFADETDFRAWYDDSLSSAAMVLDPDTKPQQTISLVTCSYNIWVKNERTVLVTSMQEQPEKQP